MRFGNSSLYGNTTTDATFKALPSTRSTGAAAPRLLRFVVSLIKELLKNEERHGASHFFCGLVALVYRIYRGISVQAADADVSAISFVTAERELILKYLSCAPSRTA